MRSRSVSWFPLVVALVICVVALAALPPLARAQTPKRGGTLRVSYGNEIANLDFHTAPGYEMMWVAMNVGCGLVNITPDGKFVGDAAESWQVSPDGLLYTFKLRKNVLFHDGTPVDAAAVKFSIDRLMDPATKSGMRSFYEAVHSVEVLDPAAPCRSGSSSPTPSCSTCWPRTARAWSSTRRPPPRSTPSRTGSRASPGRWSGAGPFKLVEWVKGSHLVMDRFDKYFEPGLPLPRPRHDPRDQGPRDGDGRLQGRARSTSSPPSRPSTSTPSRRRSRRPRS